MKRIFSRHAWADRYEVVVFISFYCIRTISVLCSPLPTPFGFREIRWLMIILAHLQPIFLC